MNKGLKTFFIVLTIILVPVAGGVGYWYYTRKKQESDPESKDGNTDPGNTPVSAGTSTATQTTTLGNTNFPLKMNASVKSDLVKECQTVINEEIEGCTPPMAPVCDGKYITSLTVDGYYGKKTAAAVHYLFPDTDGKTITETMYNKLTGKRPTGSYLLF